MLKFIVCPLRTHNKQFFCSPLNLQSKYFPSSNMPYYNWWRPNPYHPSMTVGDIGSERPHYPGDDTVEKPPPVPKPPTHEWDPDNHRWVPLPDQDERRPDAEIFDPKDNWNAYVDWVDRNKMRFPDNATPPYKGDDFDYSTYPDLNPPDTGGDAAQEPTPVEQEDDPDGHHDPDSHDPGDHDTNHVDPDVRPHRKGLRVALDKTVLWNERPLKVY